MSNSLWTLIVVAVFSAVLLTGASIAFVDAGTEKAVTDEQQTLDNETATELNNAAEATRIVENETVELESDGTELERGEDYLIDHGVGEITANSTEADGADVLIDYHYSVHDADTSAISAVFGAFEPVAALLMLVVGALAVWGWTGGFE